MKPTDPEAAAAIKAALAELPPETEIVVLAAFKIAPDSTVYELTGYSSMTPLAAAQVYHASAALFARPEEAHVIEGSLTQ